MSIPRSQFIGILSATAAALAIEPEWTMSIESGESLVTETESGLSMWYAYKKYGHTFYTSRSVRQPLSGAASESPHDPKPSLSGDIVALAPECNVLNDVRGILS